LLLAMVSCTYYRISWSPCTGSFGDFFVASLIMALPLNSRACPEPSPSMLKFFQ
jgi:hypothetical protein